MSVEIDKSRIIDNEHGGQSYVIFPSDGITLGTDKSKELMDFLELCFGENDGHRVSLRLSEKSFWLEEYTGRYE